MCLEESERPALVNDQSSDSIYQLKQMRAVLTHQHCVTMMLQDEQQNPSEHIYRSCLVVTHRLIIFSHLRGQEVE